MLTNEDNCVDRMSTNPSQNREGVAVCIYIVTGASPHARKLAGMIN